MMDTPLSIAELFNLLNELNGHPFSTYQQLLHRVFDHDRFQIRFLHIQGSPGAFPASVCLLGVRLAELGLGEEHLTGKVRRMAAADYLLRAFHEGVLAHARQNRGVQGSGSFQPLSLPPQVLQRNCVRFSDTEVHIAFHLSLPGSWDNRVLGRQAVAMLDRELTGIVRTLMAAVARSACLQKHCDTVEDMVVLQKRLSRYGLVAFVGDGSILPRQSGVSQKPLQDKAIPLHAPDRLAVELELPNGGRVRGLGIRPGVNVLIGGSFHGKSTLLDALVKGVYPHIPGDGRERVITHADAAFVCAEEGRAVTGLDISGFFDSLPGGADAKQFTSINASGSTSEAAALVEAVLGGAKLLLIDEDSSATNFLIRDQTMRRLLPEDPITPLFDRVRELYQRFGVSTLVVVGGSSEYLGVADQVIGMRNYLPVDMTDRLQGVALPAPEQTARPLAVVDRRRILPDNFDPSYRSSRLATTIEVRIKPLRLHDKVLEYGDQQLDLSSLVALVDPHQVAAVGYALLCARRRLGASLLSPSDLAAALSGLIEQEGLDNLWRGESGPLFFARPRRLELAGAIHRLRNLHIILEDQDQQAGQLLNR